ncbi:MAG: hypothetical protein A2365_00450 [Candidatus Nealsonbacteria bacterium RIFOXYB1_FULL_40_15]|uniref:Glycosyl transferase family 4 n=2 Tax=Candidatus Nealsoniibacteriota TaxID=1817911 RepID=A0A1G2ER02_9BACT|nr:MAG: hypothetical protein A2365_00450 [Candidatus Nealsonbacteria bacterium RIFOXYB1_FULL_40_15]OGZ28177.1 MAG: hypothetical protein A2427_00690 [Candidatus Nealsonbacteria bacterium RIFOXYC1_FULL_40_7]OGZ29021.1 MAG: hypothetical protein A2562_00880 [Candidatus Nealsonbacteria bacterium RIFOXYD1_FULL_39_11]
MFLKFSITLLASIVFSFLFCKLGNKLKFYDNATGDPLKIHKKPVSCLGGIAIFLAFSAYNWKVSLLGAPVFLIGLLDDLVWRDRIKIKPKTKFILLILSSLFSAWLLPGPYYILTFTCIFVLINAVNYQDGMDGLAGGETAISFLGFAILGYLSGDNLISAVSFSMFLSILGFLFFNFPPAKIFMGDSGAYFIGFVLAVLACNFSILASIFVAGLPLFDGIYTNLRRILSGKSIFLGDREHLYDKLLKKGFSSRKTLVVSYSVQIIFVIIGICIFRFQGLI